MDVLTSETCWALNNETTKQVTSSWPLFIQQILRVTQSGRDSRRGQRQNNRSRCTVKEYGNISESHVSVEIPAFISVNFQCVLTLTSSTANADSEMQSSFRGHNPFFLNPCGFYFNSVSNSKFLQPYRRNYHSEVIYYSKPWFFHGVYIPTFILNLSMKQFLILVALNNPNYY